MRNKLVIGWGVIITLIAAEWTYAERRPAERLGRGFVAIPRQEGGVYLGWRLLRSDPPDIGFNLYRQTGDSEEIQLNDTPLRQTTDFVDANAPLDKPNRWRLSIASGRQASDEWAAVSLPADPPIRNYLSIPFQGNYVCNRVAIADLNGDGKYDFVIKQPHQVSDPGVWRKSETAWKVEAYLSDGTFLWRKDLGWNIEQGVWWSPMIAFDFNGNGRAEVALKTAPTDVDYRNPDDHPLAGRVTTGPEYCSILDGLTGKELDRVDWVARGHIEDWGDPRNNRASRHLIGAAYLDGKRPSLLVLRGTYTLMRVDAYNLEDDKLVKLWSWSGDEEDPPVRGQGMHGMLAADVTGNGRDEIILGAAVLRGDGTLLWNTGLGHPDACYVADILPDRPGLEIIYGIEPRRDQHAICLVDAATGNMIWGCDFPTTHVHSSGMFGNFDPNNPGMEFYIGEKDRSAHWTFSADGRLLRQENLGRLNPVPLYWEAGEVKPYADRGRIQRYHGPVIDTYEGAILAVADILGDWREELITVVPGELRIYTTTVSAADRRITLMQDDIYRMYVAMASMGYLYPPQLSTYLEVETGK